MQRYQKCHFHFVLLLLIDNTKVYHNLPGQVTVIGKFVVFSGSQAGHLLPEPGGCNPCLFPEDVREVGLFLKTELIADLSHRQVGGDQEVLGFRQLPGLDDLGNALLQDILAYEVEVPGRHKQLFRIKADAFGFFIMLFQEFEKVSKRAAVDLFYIFIILIQLSPLRLDHGEQGAQQLPCDGQVRRLLYKFVMDHTAELVEPEKAGGGLHGDIGILMKGGIQLKGRLGNKFGSEAKYPDIAFTILWQWPQPMDLALGYKTDERGVDDL